MDIEIGTLYTLKLEVTENGDDGFATHIVAVKARAIGPVDPFDGWPAWKVRDLTADLGQPEGAWQFEVVEFPSDEDMSWDPENDGIDAYFLRPENRSISRTVDIIFWPGCPIAYYGEVYGVPVQIELVEIVTGEDAVIISCDLVNDKTMICAVIEPGCVDWGVILSEMLTRFGDDVLEFLAHHYPDLDMHEYEGGVNYWWGIGSVTIDELGLSFSMEVHDGATVVRITRGPHVEVRYVVDV